MNASHEGDEPELFVDPSEDQPLVPRRPLDDNEMDITPMIDITFLLLIFFLVAGRMDDRNPVQLPTARHGTSVASKTSVVLTMAAGDGRQAQVYLGDGKSPEKLLDSTDLVAQENAIQDYVEKQLQDPVQPKSTVVIKAEKTVKHREVARVTAAAARAGSDLYVAVLEEP